MIRCIAVLLFLLAPALASASCGYSYPTYYSRPVYYAKPYYIPVARYFDVPLYTAAYVPPVGLTTTTTTTTQTAQTATTATVARAATGTVGAVATAGAAAASKRDLAELKVWFMAELRAMRQQMGAPPARAPAPAREESRRLPTATEGLMVAQNVCGVCHREGAPEKDSAGFVLFDRAGKYLPMSAEQMVASIRMVASGKMPKVPNDKGVRPLTDEQGVALGVWLDSLKMKTAEEKIPASPEYVSIKQRVDTPRVIPRRIRR